jgi:hypothetical protein
VITISLPLTRQSRSIPATLTWKRAPAEADARVASLFGAAGVEHTFDLGDFRRRKSAHLSMFPNRAFILGKVDAKGLAVRQVALDPLDVSSPDLAKSIVGCGGRTGGVDLRSVRRRQGCLFR